MKAFLGDMKFKKPWRTYQARVLSELEESLEDKRFHVIAPPGSGKTVLGLEVVRRLNKPTLILSPTLTIRDQWVERLVQLFLPSDETDPEWVSKDIRNPKFLTAATYQALHSAYTGESQSEEEGEEENSITAKSRNLGTFEKVDIVGLLRNAGIRVVVLDEAHHLRNEWWKTLTEVIDRLESPTIVALTATPPYDVPPFEWERYNELCGPTDSEVSVPELVLAKDLCPHQDYVYLSSPTEDEQKSIRGFRDQIADLVKGLSSNQDFILALEGHPWITDPDNHIEEILADPAYISSILIFLESIGKRAPERILQILGVSGKKLPKLDLEWLETLLTGCLFTDAESFESTASIMKELRHEFNRAGAVERRTVKLREPEKVEKLLATSLSKMESIVEIARLESRSLGSNLRMVILTDFIRRDELPKNSTDMSPLRRIGVVPIFEAIRREKMNEISLAAVSGSLVIIPRSCTAQLERIASEMGMVSDEIHLSPLECDKNYLMLETEGKTEQSIVQLMTRLFTDGGITLLVGTKSLLGEGWDAPRMNSLILASFVGSYMLSNQMRGRAMRVTPQDPTKTANIWHLVCIESEKEPGNDFETMVRRFKAFVGVSLREPIIENGLDRMGLGEPPFKEERIALSNSAMRDLALDREGLSQRWKEALERGTHIADGVGSTNASLPRGLVLRYTISAMLTEGLALGAFVLSIYLRDFAPVARVLSLSFQQFLLLGFGIAAIAAAPRTLKAIWLSAKHFNFEWSMKQVGQALVQTLTYIGVIKTPPFKLRVEVEYPKTRPSRKSPVVICSLEGGTTYEKSMFRNTLKEILGPIENPKYILMWKSIFNRILKEDYYTVPETIGKKKEYAEYFEKMWNKYVAPTKLVYTRAEKGRRQLLRARARSLQTALNKKSEQISCWR